MESGMFSSVKHLVGKNLSRSMAVWVLYTIALILLFPIGTLLSFYLYNYSAETLAVSSLLSTALSGSNTLCAIFAMIAAALCFGYLDSSRSVYMMQAFPVTRNRLFATGVISGLLLALVPCVIALSGAALLAIGIDAPLGAALLSSFAVYTLEYLFYFGLSVFCMMITGTVVAAVLVYGFLNIAAYTYFMLVLEFLEPMLYGFSGTADMTIFTPFLRFIIVYPNSVPELWAEYGPYLAGMAAVGIALGAAALPIYHLRNPETAGEFIACRPFRPVFKYLFTLLTSLSVGALLCVLILSAIRPNALPVSTLLCLLAAAVLGYYIAEMILRKTKRVFQSKTLVGLAVFCLVLSCAYAVPLFDLMGYENRIPNPEDVECVDFSIQGREVVLCEPQEISFVTDLHNRIYAAYDKRNETDMEFKNISITYTLKNGKTISRVYPRVCCVNGETPYADTAGLEINTRYIEQLFEGTYQISLDYWDEEGNYISMEFTGKNADKLKAAILADAAAGSIDMMHTEYLGGTDIYFYHPKHSDLITVTENTRNLFALLNELGISAGDPVKY